MRGNIHFIIPSQDLEICKSQWEKETIPYEWGTRTAKRRFCRTCGILPFYTPRSNPDGVAVTLACVDFGNYAPKIVVKKYDGVHWEASYAATNIAKETSRT